MQREPYKRSIVLCLAVAGILLGSSSADLVCASVQTRTPARERKQKTRLGDLVEEFSFLIKDFKVDHQGENNNLNITITVRYRPHLGNDEYPDFMLIARDIETLLTRYPNEEDYWEIVNKRITLMVLEKNPAITRITSQIQVSPSIKDPYLRSSIVTRDRTMSKKPSRHTPAVK